MPAHDRRSPRAAINRSDKQQLTPEMRTAHSSWRRPWLAAISQREAGFARIGFYAGWLARDALNEGSDHAAG